jgi:hypothetical protein
MKRFKSLAVLVSATFLSWGAHAATMVMGAYPSSLILVDEGKGATVGRIQLKTGLPTNMKLSVDRKKLYVTTNTNSGIEVVDMVTKKVINSFELNTPETRYRFGGGVADPNGKFFYTIVTQIDKKIDRFQVHKPKFAIIDLEQKKVSKLFDIAKEDENTFRGYGRGGLEISADGKYLYNFGEKVTVLSTEDFKVVDRIELARASIDGLHNGSFGSVLDSIQEPGVYTSMFNAADPDTHLKTFGVGRFELDTRKFEFTPIGPAPASMAGLQLHPNKRDAYTVVSTGANGNKRCEFWHFDMQTKVMKNKSEFECKTRFTFGMSANGQKLYIYGASFDLESYDSATLRFEKTWDLQNDVTMAGYVIVN